MQNIVNVEKTYIIIIFKSLEVGGGDDATSGIRALVPCL